MLKKLLLMAGLFIIGIMAGCTKGIESTSKWETLEHSGLNISFQYPSNLYIGSGEITSISLLLTDKKTQQRRMSINAEDICSPASQAGLETVIFNKHQYLKYNTGFKQEYGYTTSTPNGSCISFNQSPLIDFTEADKLLFDKIISTVNFKE